MAREERYSGVGKHAAISRVRDFRRINLKSCQLSIESLTSASVFISKKGPQPTNMSLVSLPSDTYPVENEVPESGIELERSADSSVDDRSSPMRKLKDEQGQMLVLTAVCISMLCGLLALAIDVGVLFRAKRNVQTAADAAAIAGALNYSYNGSQSAATTAARTAAGNNGISNTATEVTVNFNPNITSAYHNGSGYVQAIVSQPNPTFFMGVFNKNSISVAASAIAGTTPARLVYMFLTQPMPAPSISRVPPTSRRPVAGFRSTPVVQMHFATRVPPQLRLLTFTLWVDRAPRGNARRLPDRHLSLPV